MAENEGFEISDHRQWTEEVSPSDDWQRGGMCVELDAYAEGGRGLWEHVLHVLYGRPIRTRKNYRLAYYIQTTAPVTTKVTLDEVVLKEDRR